MDVVIVIVLFATVVLRVIFVAAFAYLVLPRGNACPHCAAPLTPVRSGWLGLLTGIEERLCLECGWMGLTRRYRVAAHPEARRSAGPP
jgi:hypothetical protein